MAKTLRLKPSLPARLAGDRGGAAAVEFALVAAPFLLLVFALIELGLVSLVSVTLENTIMAQGRRIRTGEVQTTAVTAADFKTAVCGQMTWLANQCPTALDIDVRSFPAFSNSQAALNLAPQTPPCWDPGGPGSVVLIRARYSWPLIAPLMGTGLQSADGKAVISATTAFANEPYSDTAAAPKC